MTDAHNQYRYMINGIPSLSWLPELQTAAQQWADTLSSNLLFEHSTVADQGENLWMGPPQTTAAVMVQDWGAEKQYFKYGVFPDVSTTGNWYDVGHYTQIIWKNTVHVGCGSAVGSDGYLRLVCRYHPPGNYVGETVY